MKDQAQREFVPTSIIADTADARRLAEAINRLGGQFMAALDGAIRTRSAPAAAQRARHIARSKFEEAALQAMFALGHATPSDDTKGDYHG